MFNNSSCTLDDTTVTPGTGEKELAVMPEIRVEEAPVTMAGIPCVALCV